LVAALAGVGPVFAGAIGGERAQDLDLLGRARFADCEFKQAAKAFEQALRWQPDDAGIHNRLGKSYARLAEISSLLSAPGHARKARRNLERAVALEPANQEFLRDLFEFYLDSPQWFGGGIDQAATLLERLSADDPAGRSLFETRLKEARQDSSGASWCLRLGVLWPTQKASYLLR
jgi:cytochrome c-type biogenesis protein CcmH/NrfG